MRDTPLEVIRIAFPSSLGNEDFAVNVFDTIVDGGKYEIEEPKKVRYAIQEACMNAIQHGNRLDSHKPVNVAFELYKDALQIFIEDSGKGFDFKTYRPPTVRERINNGVKAGWGIELIRKMVREVESFTTENGNALKLVVRSRCDE